MDDTAFDRFMERYQSGSVPWDDQLPPPEVMALAAALPPGLALDLGCGYGRTTIYLAGQGWQVDGIDFVPRAVAEAARRAEAAGVSNATRFHAASVTELGFLNGRYQLAVDVGCFHALADEQQKAYHAELCRLLEPGAHYLLFARLHDPAQMENPRGLPETAVTTLFATGFTLEKTEIGITKVEDKSWKSGWFWFVRQST